MICSKDRGHNQLHEYLSEEANVANVHQKCYLKYTSKRRLDQQSRQTDAQDTETQPKLLRSSVGGFIWKTDCFICGKSAIVDDRHPGKVQISCASTTKVHESVRHMCNTRIKQLQDPWALLVVGRMDTSGGVSAADAVYHKECYHQFMYIPTGAPAGRPVDEEMTVALNQLFDVLDNTDCELYTLYELREQLQRFVGYDDVYHVKTLKRKLQEHYGEHIFFATMCGRLID